MNKLSQILAIRVFFLYSGVSEVACFTIVYFSSDGTRRALQTGNIFRSRKYWPMFGCTGNNVDNMFEVLMLDCRNYFIMGLQSLRFGCVELLYGGCYVLTYKS